MRAEDVKEQMLVLHNGKICMVFSKGEEVCYLLSHNDTGSKAKHFPVSPADFEPYEEPKEDWFKEGVHLTTELFNGSVRINVELFSPITQEFIESFGFVIDDKTFLPDYFSYDKVCIVGGEEKELTLYVELLSRYTLFDRSDDETIFSDYTCTTQSELRFLLTKGRIDCSK